MIFHPDLAAKVLDGSKTQTRRRAEKDSACRYKPGQTYAIQDRRGGQEIGRIVILGVSRVPIPGISRDDAAAEGFSSPAEFYARWRAMYRVIEGDCWRIEFRLAESA